jgi:hypothetical protein
MEKIDKFKIFLKIIYGYKERIPSPTNKKVSCTNDDDLNKLD